MEEKLIERVESVRDSLYMLHGFLLARTFLEVYEDISLPHYDCGTNYALTAYCEIVEGGYIQYHNDLLNGVKWLCESVGVKFVK
ncbi:MAG: hypothetical protein LBS74_02400 [Oscillospiraceae bacterium]|jgi:hypothetical protein|nr:hypothetical protein [Oscillospiraceae bacterium]